MLGPVELVDEVDSTNRVLLDRARDGAPHGLVLVADHQTEGRGRLDRRWEAAPGAALLASVLLRPRVALDEIQLLTVAGAIAARDACAAIAGADAAVKWPNDLVVERDGNLFKLAGLLAESIVSNSAVEAVVLGMGLNITEVELPDGAIALESLASSSVSRDSLLRAWLEHLDAWLVDWDAGRLLDRYRQLCSTLGRQVRVEAGDQVVEGRAQDIDPAGRLLVETAGGIRCFAVGDVQHVRAV